VVHLLRHIAGNYFFAQLAGSGHGDRERGASITKDGLTFEVPASRLVATFL
jgi:hypothetical protein